MTRALIFFLVLAAAFIGARAADPLAPSLSDPAVADFSHGLQPACIESSSFCYWNGPPRVCSPDGQHCLLLTETTPQAPGTPSLACDSHGNVVREGDILLNHNLFSGRSETSGNWERNVAPGWQLEVRCRKRR